MEQSIASIKKSFVKGNYKLRILCIQLEHKFEGTQGRMKKFNQMRNKYEINQRAKKNNENKLRFHSERLLTLIVAGRKFSQKKRKT